MEEHTRNADEQFHSSNRSRMAKTRLWLWLGLVIGVATNAARHGTHNIGLSVVASVLIALLVEWVIRKAMRKGRALVTLNEAGIESPLFPGSQKHHRWQDITACSIEWAQGVPQLELRLAPSTGIPDKRNFWNGANPARPRITLAALAPEAQERLTNAVLAHLERANGRAGESDVTNPLRIEREFQERLKALAPTPWVTYALIGANVLIWLVNVGLGASITHTPADKLLSWGGNAASEVQRGEWWRLLSATFLHGGVVHLAMNMIGLAGAGVMIERIYGRGLFALIYLGSGLIGSAMSLHFAAQHAVSVGASGAVFGVTGALLVAVWQHRHALPKSFGSQTIKGIGIFILYSLIQGVTKQGIDNAAHVGGLLGGCLLAYILPERLDMAQFQRRPRTRRMAAIFGTVVATAGLAFSAPPAEVDMKQRLAVAAFAERGIQGFLTAMRQLEQEERDVAAGKLTAIEADDRSRTVHAPALRAVLNDLRQASLPPNDPRAPLLTDFRHLAELIEESLAMDSVVDAASGTITPANPARAAAIKAESTAISQRLRTATEALKLSGRH